MFGLGRFAVLILQDREVSPDGIADVGQGLLFGPSLGHATGQSRDIRNVPFALFGYEDIIFHARFHSNIKIADP